MIYTFNGAFQQRGGPLGYVGGETRILAVNRGAGIAELLGRISSQFFPRFPPVCVKYRLPEADAAGDRPLISVDSDEDVHWMIEEHDRLMAEGRGTRIRVFVCHSASKSSVDASNIRKKICSSKSLAQMNVLSRNMLSQLKSHQPGTSHIRNNGLNSFNAFNDGNSSCDTVNRWIYRLQEKQCSSYFNNWLKPKQCIAKLQQAEMHYLPMREPAQATQALLVVGKSRGNLKKKFPASTIGRDADYLFCVYAETGEIPTHKQSEIFCGGAHCNEGPQEVDKPVSFVAAIEEENCFSCSLRGDHVGHNTSFSKPLNESNPFVGNVETAFLGDLRKPNISEVASKLPLKALVLSSGLERSLDTNYLSSYKKIEEECMLDDSNAVLKLKSDRNDLHDALLIDLAANNLSLPSSLERSVSSFMSSTSNDTNGWLLAPYMHPVDNFTKLKSPTITSSIKTVAPASATDVQDFLTRNKHTKAALVLSNIENKDDQKVLDHSFQTKAGIENLSLHVNFSDHSLQTIKNSDLEEVQELGTGTYGTVFYGRWKGSDVAIKRIKPSYFTGGESGGKDRLTSGRKLSC